MKRFKCVNCKKYYKNGAFEHYFKCKSEKSEFRIAVKHSTDHFAKRLERILNEAYIKELLGIKSE